MLCFMKAWTRQHVFTSHVIRRHHVILTTSHYNHHTLAQWASHHPCILWTGCVYQLVWTTSPCNGKGCLIRKVHSAVFRELMGLLEQFSTPLMTSWISLSWIHLILGDGIYRIHRNICRDLFYFTLLPLRIVFDIYFRGSLDNWLNNWALWVNY